MTAPTLVPVLGDQLSLDLPSLAGVDRSAAVVLMMEVREEATYVRHHKRKIAYLFSAMRHHADALRAEGWTVDYVALTDPANAHSLTGEVARAVERHRPARVRVTEPGEWRLRTEFEGWADRFEPPVEMLEDSRFLCAHEEFDRWAGSRRELVMEDFYRSMRRKTGLLMDGGRPEGGRWNYDKENRRPPRQGLTAPDLPAFAPDAVTREVLALVAAEFADHPGSLAEFGLAVTREQALRAQAHFLDHRLARFGDWQDAMVRGEPFLFHAVLSFYINAGLLDPLQLCREVEARYRDGRCPLNAAEGFIRQVIGWREYMRGIYWREGPDYARRNHLDAHRALPSFYYDGRTDMACMADAIGNTLAHAYAHHIQRLMITGNFALIAGLDPVAVQAWYLEVYADAYEWVECPNTLGMILYGDGGLLGSKPYAASGNYIDRMSDYCGGCRYDPKLKLGEADACPFNALYWDFLARNEDKLRGNRRLRYPYQTWDRMGGNRRAAIRGGAAEFLDSLERDG